MDQTTSSNTLAQAAPLLLEEYPDAANSWHPLAGMLDEADGQDLSVLSENLDDLKTSLEEAEKVWSAFRDDINRHAQQMGKEEALKAAMESAPYGFSIISSCLEKMEDLHSALDAMLSEESMEQ